MNYQAAALIGTNTVDKRSIPIGSDWKRVNFALAGYGYLVPGTMSDPATATLEHSVVESCTITHSVVASATITHSVTGA